MPARLALLAWLIPAWAGKTRRSTGRRRCCPAHPRMGGENPLRRHHPAPGGGSSPHGRGKLLRSYRGCFVSRLIPAWAGKTMRITLNSTSLTAHPRMGGENNRPHVSERVHQGSSPRGRGKPPMRHQRPPKDRLIPARAGKTMRATAGTTRRRAHPRAGGENGTVRSAGVPWAGSSPRGRGKLLQCFECRPGRGFIPARAGKTPGSSKARQSSRAHPRAGGENQPNESYEASVTGSSPRGRGKRQQNRDAQATARLIPARAGKTGLGAALSDLISAHPRAGGENDASAFTPGHALGSSPRGRGKLCSMILLSVMGRLIPARAGKT